MGLFLSIVGFLMVPVAIIWLVVNFIRKKKKLIPSLSIVAGIFICFTGLWIVGTNATPEQLAKIEEDKKAREERLETARLEKEKAEKEKAEKEKLEEKEKEKEAPKEKKNVDKEDDAKKNKNSKKKEVESEKNEEEQKNTDNLPTAEKIVEKFDVVDSAALSNGELLLVKDPGFAWDETTYISNYSLDMFKAMQEGFSDPSVKKVIIEMNADLIDDKGHESARDVVSYTYERATFESLNYDNFIKLAFGEEWRIFTESDDYSIHPALYWEIEEKYREHLYLSK